MKSLKLKMSGKSPLLMSCDRLADPLDPLTVAHKALTSKRKKTEEDHIEIAKSQWNGLLYLNADGQPCLPSTNIRASLVSGAKINKLGMQVKRGTLIFEDSSPLDYGKKLTVGQLWDLGYIDRRSVVVGGAKVICYRPKFTQWSCSFELLYDENTLDEGQLLQAFNNAGNYCGIGGFRPEKGGFFGRFDVEKI